MLDKALRYWLLLVLPSSSSKRSLDISIPFFGFQRQEVFIANTKPAGLEGKESREGDNRGRSTLVLHDRWRDTITVDSILHTRLA